MKKMRDASLLEFFTSKQIRIHINSLRQFVGLVSTLFSQGIQLFSCSSMSLLWEGMQASCFL
ncbi:hypothetical protein AMTRI_Chr03g144990 [Amborella trichopoda]